MRHVPHDAPPPLRSPRRLPEEVGRVDVEAAAAPPGGVLEGALLHELDLDVELEAVGGEGRHLRGGEGRRLEDDEQVSAAGYHRRDGAAAAKPGSLFRGVVVVMFCSNNDQFEILPQTSNSTVQSKRPRLLDFVNFTYLWLASSYNSWLRFSRQ